MESKSATRAPQVEEVEEADGAAQNHELSKWSGAGLRVCMIVLAIGFNYIAQIVLLVGAGLLAQSIGRALGNIRHVSWFSTSITISLAALGPIVSHLADYFGRKRLLVILTAFGFIGSMIIARATGFAMVVGGFIITGIAISNTGLEHTIVSEIVPRHRRPIVQGILNVLAGVGGIFGSLLGGALVREDPAGFRTYFYVLAALFGSAAIIISVAYNPPKRLRETSLTTSAKLRDLDWVGYGLFISGLTLFSVALAWSQNPYSWSDAHILTPFCISVALLAGLVLYETILCKDGIFHRGLFRHRNFGLSLVCIAVEGLVFFSFNNYFGFEDSVLNGADNFVVGSRYALMFAGAMLAAAITGFYSSLTKQVRFPAITGFLVLLIFNVTMATKNPDGIPASYWALAVPVGVGIGILLPTLMVIAQLSTDPDLISTTSGLIISARSLGATIGLTINTALLSKGLSTIGSKIAGATLPLGLEPSALGPNLCEYHVYAIHIPFLVMGPTASCLFRVGFNHLHEPFT